MSKYGLVVLALLVCAGAAQAQDPKDKKDGGFEYRMEQWRFWSPESYEAFGPHTWGNWGGFDWKGNRPWDGGWGDWKQRQGWGGFGGRGQRGGRGKERKER